MKQSAVNDNSDLQEIIAIKNVKSKVNCGLARSKSAYGRHKLATFSKPKYQLDLSPMERINVDLKERISDDIKNDIKEYVNKKYEGLEQMLQSNLGNRATQEITNS